MSEIHIKQIATKIQGLFSEFNSFLATVFKNPAKSQNLYETCMAMAAEPNRKSFTQPDLPLLDQ